MHAYIDVDGQRLTEIFPGYRVPATSRLQSQCANTTFADQSRYNRLFQKVMHKQGEQAINHFKIFQNAKALEISVVIIYTKYQLMHTFLYNFHQGGK